MTALQFLCSLMVYCHRFHASVTSYGRSQRHNAAVGGVEYSAHLYWVGSDVLYDELPPLAECIEVGERLGLRVIREGDHDHLQPLDWRKG